MAVRLPQSLRLGHTQIRLVDPKVAVAPARKLVPDHWLTRLCSQLPVALLLLLGHSALIGAHLRAAPAAEPTPEAQP